MAWRESQMWRRPPSEIFGIGFGTYDGYCFDQAVSRFGLWVESELDKLEKKGKETKKLIEARRRRLDKILNDDPSSQTKSFADPAALFK